MSQKGLLALAVLAFLASMSQAEVKTRVVTYSYGGKTFKGYIAYDDARKDKRPGVLVVHEWWGLNDFARKKTEELAKLGYVAFAADMYGDGKTAKHPQDAGKFAGEVRKNVKEWQGRAKAALKVLTDMENVDAKKLAAIGYCFGGSTALQLAYSGADLKVVATFHAALPVPTEEQAKAIKAKLLINHGARDTFIPEKVITQFREALDKAKVDYQMVYYAGAQHSFSVPDADKAKVKGLSYNAKADKRSWQAMLALFKETFPSKK